MPGTTASLTSINGTAALVDGTFEQGFVTLIDLRDQDSGDFFDPSKFRLTLHDGRVLDLGQATGLEKVTDNNGNVVEIKATGIDSSNGRSVTFTRDTQGRITGITDPANHSLAYTYDGAGDLVTFQDLVGNPTQYAYDSNHYPREASSPSRTPTTRTAGYCPTPTRPAPRSPTPTISPTGRKPSAIA
jgi:YD repeat-containing protein